MKNGFQLNVLGRFEILDGNDSIGPVAKKTQAIQKARMKRCEDLISYRLIYCGPVTGAVNHKYKQEDRMVPEINCTGVVQVAGF